MAKILAAAQHDERTRQDAEKFVLLGADPEKHKQRMFVSADELASMRGMCAYVCVHAYLCVYSGWRVFLLLCDNSVPGKN